LSMYLLKAQLPQKEGITHSTQRYKPSLGRELSPTKKSPLAYLGLGMV
jgi:hypothetical protein